MNRTIPKEPKEISDYSRNNNLRVQWYNTPLSISLHVHWQCFLMWTTHNSFFGFENWSRIRFVN